jgi:glycyl-tRNA synthetase beta chain
MPELLFELGCEEIPAEDLLQIVPQLKRVAEQSFTSNRIPPKSIQTYGTPRRLVLVAGIPAKQEDRKEQKLGPPQKISIDAAGHPTPAGLGFAKNMGVPFEQLKIVSTPKGDYIGAEIVEKGNPTTQVLIQVLPEIVSQLSFKKFMKWGEEKFLFGRPIRNLLLLFDGEVVPLTIAGVQAGRTTFGHRFMGKKRLEIASFESYRKQLQQNGVILDFNDRVEKISRELREQSKAAGGVLKEDQDLLITMANEVEFPEVLKGNFSEEFLLLPQEILINAMRKHQKYFSVLGPKDRLLASFLTVMNTHAENPEQIRRNHERVLEARLRDAEFFWREDRKKSLASRIEGLSRLTYQEKLGSYEQKIQRMLSIGSELLSQLNRIELKGKLEHLIRHSKTDLLTSMVGEFPELQGIMAGLYTKEEGWDDEAWQALYDQYLPATADDPLPRNFAGALLSLCDRLEALVSGYILNRIPTGSKDPYGLRRVATGIMRIILEYQLDLDLLPLFDKALMLYSIKTKLSRDELLHSLLDLMETRFRFLMEQNGIPYDYLNAVLAVEKSAFYTAYQKVNSLWSKKDSPDLKTLARGFKRIQNIISGQPEFRFDPELLEEDGEKRLHQVFSDVEFRIKQLIDERQYLDALDIMVSLGPEIDNFFDEVLVMTENTTLQQNRIALLQNLSSLYRRIADFSELQLEM